MELLAGRVFCSEGLDSCSGGTTHIIFKRVFEAKALHDTVLNVRMVLIPQLRSGT